MPARCPRAVQCGVREESGTASLFPRRRCVDSAADLAAETGRLSPIPDSTRAQRLHPRTDDDQVLLAVSSQIGHGAGVAFRIQHGFPEELAGPRLKRAKSPVIGSRRWRDASVELLADPGPGGGPIAAVGVALREYRLTSRTGKPTILPCSGLAMGAALSGISFGFFESG